MQFLSTKRLLTVLIALAAIPALAYAALLMQHNRSQPPLTPQEAMALFQGAERWIVTNRAQVLAQDNPILWWMVKRAVELRPSPELDALWREFRQSYDLKYPQSPWRPFLRLDARPLFNPPGPGELDDYQIHFLYGLTCNRELENAEGVRAQLSAGFCFRNHPLTPACATHQWMGLRLMQDRQCGDSEATRRVMSELEQDIEAQLFRDVRRVDAFAQRLWVLADAGQGSRIRPQWLRRLASAELNDGGWSDFDPLFPVGASRYFGFSNRIVGIRQPRANFHTTAQVLLLGALLSR